MTSIQKVVPIAKNRGGKGRIGATGRGIAGGFLAVEDLQRVEARVVSRVPGTRRYGIQPILREIRRDTRSRMIDLNQDRDRVLSGSLAELGQ